MRSLFVALVLTAPASAASLHIGYQPAPSPTGDYFLLEFGFTTEDLPRLYAVRDAAPSDWQDLDPYHERDPWTLPAVWIPRSSPAVDFKPRMAFDWVRIDVTEFLEAGDNGAQLVLDSRRGPGEPWNTVEWESPHLGRVGRSYAIVHAAPEPAAIWLAWAVIIAAASLHFLPRRRR